MADKPIVWLGDSRDATRGFLPDARQVAGFQLRRVQQGLEPNDWKPMASIGRGVREIRIRTDTQHRILYLANLDEAIYVLHAFEKKSQRTPRAALELAKERLSTLLQQRTRAAKKGR